MPFADAAAEVLDALRCCFSCDVLEGFGQTETSAVASINWLGDYRAGGSIGAVLPWYAEPLCVNSF